MPSPLVAARRCEDATFIPYAHRRCALPPAYRSVFSLNPKHAYGRRPCGICGEPLQPPGETTSPRAKPAPAPAGGEPFRLESVPIRPVVEAQRRRGRVQLVHAACMRRGDELVRKIGGDVDLRSLCPACGRPLQPLDAAQQLQIRQKGAKRTMLVYARCFALLPPKTQREFRILFRSPYASAFRCAFHGSENCWKDAI